MATLCAGRDPGRWHLWTPKFTWYGILFCSFPLFALLLAGKRGWEPIVVSIAGVGIALLTASRATIGFGGLGYALTFAISALRSWTFRKGVFAVTGILTLVVLAPLAVSTLDKRFSLNPISDEYDERAAFESAAASMLSDHPMGIGANDYVIVANTQGYKRARWSCVVRRKPERACS